MSFNHTEKKVIFSISGVFLARMLGIFSILPVLGLYADSYSDYSVSKTGIALGIFGLTQMLLFVPMGIWADKTSKFRVIYCCLLLFLLGSLICALADSLFWVIIGRAIQGSGAMAGVLMALATNYIDDRRKGLAMMIFGSSIGCAFLLGFAFAPIFAQQFNIGGIFWLNVALAAFAMLWLFLTFPKDQTTTAIQLPTSSINWALFKQHILNNNTLMTVNISSMLAHSCLMAIFIILPKLLMTKLQLDSSWELSVILISTTAIGALSIVKLIRKPNTKPILTLCILAAIGLTCLQVGITINDYVYSYILIIVGLILFMSFLCFMESAGPAITSSFSNAQIKSSTMSIYTSFQFSGVLIGGVCGGYILEYFSATALFSILKYLLIIWAMLILRPLPKTI